MLPLLSKESRIRNRLKKLQLIASDIDGTLLRSNNVLSTPVREAISKVKSVGVHVVLLSNRTPLFVHKLSRVIDTPFPSVGLNGAVIIDQKGRYLKSWFLPSGVSHTVAEIARKSGETSIVAFSADGVLYEREPRRIPQYLGELPEEIKRVDSLQPYYDSTCMYVVSAPYTLIQDLSRKLSHRHQNEVVKITYSSHSFPGIYYLEIRSRSVTKETALRWILKRYGYTRREVAAIGDFDNDLEMCRYAGIGVAMANATHSLKRVCDIILRKTNEEDGAVDFLMDVYEVKSRIA